MFLSVHGNTGTLTALCCGENHFWLCLFGVLCVSCLLISLSFSVLGNFYYYFECNFNPASLSTLSWTPSVHMLGCLLVSLNSGVVFLKLLNSVSTFLTLWTFLHKWSSNCEILLLYSFCCWDFPLYFCFIEFFISSNSVWFCYIVSVPV